jgi:hypothetical protein
MGFGEEFRWKRGWVFSFINLLLQEVNNNKWTMSIGFILMGSSLVVDSICALGQCELGLTWVVGRNDC